MICYACVQSQLQGDLGQVQPCPEMFDDSAAQKQSVGSCNGDSCIVSS